MAASRAASRAGSAALKLESDDGGGGGGGGQHFVPLAAARASVDSDVHMTDATDGTADTTAAALKAERFSSPLSTASTTATTAAANGKKTKAAGAASAASRRGGGGRAGSKAASRGGGRRGGSASSSKTRGGGGGSGAARKKKLAESNNKSLLSSAKATYAASPSPSVKREPASDEDDGDNEEEEEEDEDEDERGEEDEDADNDDEDDEDDDDASDHGPYCICRGPDDHRWMIQCDECEDWFHGDCVKISKEEGENLIVSYICPNCAIPGRYVTRFRKLCSSPGCRKPARLYSDDSALAVARADASHFCSDAHRDQWWDAVLARVERGRAPTSAGAAAAAEAKLAVGQLTPAQLVAVLSRTDEPGVAQMLLHGLTAQAHESSSSSSSKKGSSDLDASLLTDEERATTQASAADRYHLAEQVVMCKKMLELLDRAKTRHQDAVKAGRMERDCCGYDERLQHVGVQPHFARFLAGPEGAAVFRAAADNSALAAPRFGEDGSAIEYAGDGGNGDDGDNDAAATAGMCGKRKCKAHAGWFSTLARDVRMQMQEFTRQAGALRDNETRIRLAAIQRSFVKQHTASEVRYVGDSDNSLSSLAGGGGHASDDDDDDEAMADYDSSEDDEDRSNVAARASPRSTGSPAYNTYGLPSHAGGGANGSNGHSQYHTEPLTNHANGQRRNGRSPDTDDTVSD